MKTVHIILSILCLVFGSLSASAQEKHPHQHSDKTKESHSSGNEQGHSHAEEENSEKREEGEHGDEHEHKEHEGGESSHKEGEAHEEGHGDEHKEEGEEEFSSSVGPGNAVMAADERLGIQISEKAQRRIEIQLLPASSTLPKGAIVSSKEETGVYRLRDGWFKFIEGKVVAAANQQVMFKPKQSDDLKKGDQVVVNGAPLLRVAELDAFAGEAAGHGH